MPHSPTAAIAAASPSNAAIACRHAAVIARHRSSSGWMATPGRGRLIGCSGSYPPAVAFPPPSNTTTLALCVPQSTPTRYGSPPAAMPSPGLADQIAAVDGEDVPVDVVGSGAGEEHDGTHQVGGVAPATGREVIEHAAARLWVAPSVGRDRSRVVARGDAI